MEITRNKVGFYRIGLVRQKGEYLREIQTLIGHPFDWNEFNSYIDTLWDNKENTLICFNTNGEQVPGYSNDISFFLIDLNMVIADTGDSLYARFQTAKPGTLADSLWSGVELGSKSDLIFCVPETTHATSGWSALSQFSYIATYEPIARVLSELTGKEYSEKDCEALLSASYDNAVANDAVGVIANSINLEKRFAYFPLTDCVTLTGERLFIKMERNSRENAKQAWFGAFLTTESDLKEAILSFRFFHIGYFKFEDQTEANKFLDSVASRAMPENWRWLDPKEASTFSQPILKSYLEFTYYRLLDEDKMREEALKLPAEERTDLQRELCEHAPKHEIYQDKCYFNSGLLDKHFRQIIIVGKVVPYTEPFPALGECTWEMLTDLKAYSHNEPEIASMYREGNLPRIASYFSDYRQVVFDAKLDIHTNDHHIFEDGVARGRLPKYSAEYERVKNNPDEKDRLLTRIARDFDSARERAALMAERNYKLAVPQFWKETGEIQFLLPIYLGEKEEAEKPQCALVLSLIKSGRYPYYRGETILTLDMAYNNTRLIAKPDVFWLNDLV